MSVQIEVDEAILPQLDQVAEQSQLSRYQLVNKILRKGLREETWEEKNRKFAESYKQFPLTQAEIDEQKEWQEIQDWGDDQW